MTSAGRIYAAGAVVLRQFTIICLLHYCELMHHALMPVIRPRRVGQKSGTRQSTTYSPAGRSNFTQVVCPTPTAQAYPYPERLCLGKVCYDGSAA